MTKQDFDMLGYTYTNLTSGYVGINYDLLFGAEESFVKELLKTLAPEITEKNLIDIFEGMDEHGIFSGYSSKNIEEIGLEELPAEYPKEDFEHTFRIECMLKGKGVYRVDYIGLSYMFGKETQKRTNAVQARAGAFNARMNKLIQSGRASVDEIARVAAGIKGGTAGENVKILLYRNYPGKDNGTLYRFDRHGLKGKTCFISGKMTENRVYKKNVVTDTQFQDGRPVSIRKTVTGMRRADEIIVTLPVYENGMRIRSKTTYSRKLAEGLQPTCFVHRNYAQDGSLATVKINDAGYGKKTYTFLTDGFEVEENGNCVYYHGKVEVSDSRDPMKALKELMWLDGAVIQLKKYVKEYAIDYSSVLDEIYRLKVEYALTAMKEKKALLYVADRGNMTMYDANFNKAAYFPISIIKEHLPNYRNYPNVLVEQKIKVSKDPEAIRLLFDFGTKTKGTDSVYAFHRVVKALAANPATPADVLSRIVDGIYTGKYDNANLVAISSNPNTDTETLQVILDHKPTILVRSHIENHPNRPLVLKARVSKKEAQNAADDIFGNSNAN